LRTLTDRPARCFCQRRQLSSSAQRFKEIIRPETGSLHRGWRGRRADTEPVRLCCAIRDLGNAPRGSFQQSIAAALSRSVYFAPGGDDISRGIFGLFVYEAGRNEPSMDFIRCTRARAIGLDFLADRVLEITETPLVDEKRVQKADGSVEITTADAVDRSRLTVDSLNEPARARWRDLLWWRAHADQKRAGLDQRSEAGSFRGYSGLIIGDRRGCRLRRNRGLHRSRRQSRGHRGQGFRENHRRVRSPAGYRRRSSAQRGAWAPCPGRQASSVTLRLEVQCPEVAFHAGRRHQGSAQRGAWAPCPGTQASSVTLRLEVQCPGLLED
jgi:hypothetical protein